MSRPRTTNRPSPVAHESRHWTEEEDALVQKMILEEGATFSEVGVVLGRTRTSVAGRLNRLRVKALPEAERRALRRRYEEASPPKPRAEKKRPVRSLQTPEPRTSIARPAPPRRFSKKESPLPYLLLKNNTILAVYHKNPYVLEPLAVFEKRSSTWVRRGREDQRHGSVPEAVRSVAA